MTCKIDRVLTPDGFIVVEASGIELQNCPAYIREWIPEWGNMDCPSEPIELKGKEEVDMR
jgi:hypothetical protein